MRIDECRNVVFDLDGVLFDSNTAKVRAARRVVADLAPEVADAFARDFSNNFGLTRRQHFECCYESYLAARGFDATIVDRMIGEYAREVRTLYEDCEVCEGALELVCALRDLGCSSAVVTGGDQQEARTLIARSAFRGLFREVLGGPESKTRNTRRLMESAGFDAATTLFIGDARQDWETAPECGAAFILVTGYSIANMTVLRDLVLRGGGRVVPSLGELIVETSCHAHTT
jgi:phosphoglycolate phosphatase-like HAD superfamily hydrolase